MNRQKKALSVFFRTLSVVIPALIHGAYDFIATMEERGSNWIFIVFILILFAISFFLVGKMSKKDRGIA